MPCSRLGFSSSPRRRRMSVEKRKCALFSAKGFVLRPRKIADRSNGKVTTADAFVHPLGGGVALEHFKELLAGADTFVTRHRNQEMVLDRDRLRSRHERSDAAHLVICFRRSTDSNERRSVRRTGKPNTLLNVAHRLPRRQLHSEWTLRAPAALAIEPERDDRANVHIEEILHGTRALSSSGCAHAVLMSLPPPTSSSRRKTLISVRLCRTGQHDLDGMHGCLRCEHLSPFLVAAAGS